MTAALMAWNFDFEIWCLVLKVRNCHWGNSSISIIHGVMIHLLKCVREFGTCV